MSSHCPPWSHVGASTKQDMREEGTLRWLTVCIPVPALVKQWMDKTILTLAPSQTCAVLPLSEGKGVEESWMRYVCPSTHQYLWYTSCASNRSYKSWSQPCSTSHLVSRAREWSREGQVSVRWEQESLDSPTHSWVTVKGTRGWGSNREQRTGTCIFVLTLLPWLQFPHLHLVNEDTFLTVSPGGCEG